MEHAMIDIEGASFTYEGETKRSLDKIDFHVKKGECVLITGPSGCGKSTLLRLISGLIPHYYEGECTGKAEVCGIIPSSVPLYMQAAKVSAVLQNPKSQFYTTDTVSELAFALENRGVPKEKIIERIGHTVTALGISDLMDRSMFSLSGGEKQKIACACADVAGTEIILLDEPTANLDYEASKQLGELILYWKSLGRTILIAEHRIAWILDTATRLVVMEDGHIACDVAQGREGYPSGIFEEYGLRSPILENPLDTDIPEAAFGSKEEGREGEYGIEARNLHFSYDGEHMVLDLDRVPIAEHKITAIAGANGKGKTTFLRCLAGLEKKDESIILFHRKEWKRKIRKKKVYLIAQDVNYQLFTQEVREEIAISLPEKVRKDPVLSKRRIEEIAEELDLSDILDRDPTTLSGGQKQRTAIAGAIASEREILLFDEPTSGLDLRHMKKIAELLRKEAACGKTILVVTHDNELIRACADYRLVL